MDVRRWRLRRPQLMRSPLLRVAAVLACLLFVPLLGTPASGTTTTAGTLTVSRTSGMPGEALTVTVSGLPGAATRPIRLERCVGYTDGTWTTCNYWVAVMTSQTANHAHTFSTRVHAMQRNRYRVVAPQTSTNGAVVTPNKPVDGTQQDATLTMPTPTVAGEPVDVTMGLSPVRASRQVALQRRNADGTWTTQAGPFAVDAYGLATTTLTLESGTSTWRTVALDWTPSTENSRVGWFPSFPTTVVVP